MTEISHADGRDGQGITNIFMKESIIIHFRTMEIGENIKIVMKTSIGMKISMIVIDLMIWIILIVETGHIVEIDCKTTVEMSIRKKVIYKRRFRDYYEEAYKDRHNRNKYKHQYRNESYNLGRDRSREKQHECNARKTPYFSKLELVDSTIQKLDPKKVITERFIKAVTEDIDDLFDSTYIQWQK